MILYCFCCVYMVNFVKIIIALVNQEKKKQAFREFRSHGLHRISSTLPWISCMQSDLPKIPRIAIQPHDGFLNPMGGCFPILRESPGLPQRRHPCPPRRLLIKSRGEILSTGHGLGINQTSSNQTGKSGLYK